MGWESRQKIGEKRDIIETLSDIKQQQKKSWLPKAQEQLEKSGITEKNVFVLYKIEGT